MRLRNILILLVILLALSGYFYISTRPEPPPPKEPQLYVWLVEMEELQHIRLELPREEKNQAFIKEADRTWHFDDVERSDVNMERWGGGIPLLLSGPGTDRVITENATEEQFSQFGLNQPQMKLTLTLEDGDIVEVNVGDRTPSGEDYYIQAPDSKAVALVDYTWYEVLEKLVKEPPYAPIE